MTRYTAQELERLAEGCIAQADQLNVPGYSQDESTMQALASLALAATALATYKRAEKAPATPVRVR